MDGVRFSIIVPTYNSERFLDRCLNSLVSQSYRNYEVIIIDDGSTDSTKDICQRYMEKSELIKYHYISNSGVSKARNIGIGYAKRRIYNIC